MMGSSKEKQSEKHEHVVGTCMGMCPNAEVRLRQREKMIHPLEMAVDSSGRRLTFSQAQSMVKMFSRPAAGQQVKASDVRPVPVLIKTVRYLLLNVCCQKDVSWALVYQFVSDRLQAVRQDLCVQGARNTMALQIYQAAVRFYIYAHYRTCEHDLKDFDPFLNLKQLLETSSLIMSIYQELDSGSTITPSDRTDLEVYTDFNYHDEESEDEDSDSDSDSKNDGAETKIVEDSKASEKGTIEREDDSEDNNKRECDGGSEEGNSGKPHHTQEVQEGENRRGNDIVSCNSHEEESVALYMLANLGNEEVIMNVLRLPQNIKCSKLVSVTLKMNLAWLTHNYYKVLKLSTRLPPLCQCAFHLHLTMIQRKSLGILNQSHSCKGQSYSLDELCDLLMYNSSDDVAKACMHYGLPVTNGGVVFTKGKFNWDASQMKPCHTKRIEDHLATVTLGDLLLPTLSY